MRLHDLSITAFGPFVDSVRVDFDDLAAGGLFLLTGDTGSGKTSVLDAVCFALYGEVPGDRHTARHLRSDQADPRAEPRVVLRLSVGGRTFRFTRSPAWERPKRRGSGTTRVQAHVVVEEQRDGELGRAHQPARRGRPARHGPAGHDLHAVHAGGDAAPGALPGLPARQLHRTARRAAATVPHPAVRGGRALARRAAARARPPVSDPPRRVRGRGQPPAGSGRGRGARRVGPARPRRGGRRRFPRALGRRASDGGIARARGSTGSAVERHRIAGTRPGGTRPGACGHRGPCPRGFGAEVLDDLAASQPLAESMAASLDAHRRAAPVLPLALRVEAAESQHTEAAIGRQPTSTRSARCWAWARTRSTRTCSRPPPPGSTRSGPSRSPGSPASASCTDERTRLRALDSESHPAGDGRRPPRKRAADLADAHARVTAALGAATPIAGRAAADRAALETAETGLEAASEAAQLDRRAGRRPVSPDRGHHGRSGPPPDLSRPARTAHLRDGRRAGGALAVGCSCPVCGSVDHPAPGHGVGQRQPRREDAAREHYEFGRLRAPDRAGARHDTGHPARVCPATQPGTFRHPLAHHRGRSRIRGGREQPRRARREPSRSGAGRPREGATAVLTELASTRVSLEERTRQQTEAAERHGRLEAERDALLADHPGVTTVAASPRSSSPRRGRARGGPRRHGRPGPRGPRAEQATASADSAVTEAGFPSLAEALAAVLPGGEAVAQARQLDERSATRAAADSVLAEEAVRAALERERARPGRARRAGRGGQPVARRAARGP